MNLLVIVNWCYGITQPYSPVFCQEVYQVGHQIKTVAPLFDACMVINDKHNLTNTEFKYIPKHGLGLDWTPLTLPKSNNIQVFTKRTLNAFHSGHIKGVLDSLQPTKILVAGFNVSLDIIPTCLSLIDLGKDIFIIPSCLGDITIQQKNEGIKYLTYLGIPVIKDIEDVQRSSVLKG